MEIYGYSERGAMNALFYGMALNDDKDAMIEFLKLVGKDLNADQYTDYKLYIECSLSDFGDPDLVIIAEKEGKGKDVFFVEAKVSHQGHFSINEQMRKHNEYCESIEENIIAKKYDASNLFFQLKLKDLFYKTKGLVKQDNNSYNDKIRCKKFKTDQDYRVLGSNKIVKQFSSLITKCEDAYFIAIVPNSDEIKEGIKDFDVRIVTWESILEKDELKKYLSETVKFNQTDRKSQILNSPWDNNKSQ